MLVRTLYLSLDPYMRGRMSAAKSYAKPVAVGQVMVGGTVGEVVASRNPNYAVGDIVLGYGGWQDYARLERRRACASSIRRRRRSRPRSACSACRA